MKQYVERPTMRRTVFAAALIGVLLASLLTLCSAQAAAPTTDLVSLTQSGGQGNGDSRFPAISADGRYVVFESRADNLVPDDTNGAFDIFVRDRVNGITERVSIGQGGVQANGTSDSAVISNNGQFVAFRSEAFNLTGGE